MMAARDVDILVVGAGMAGLAAARHLRQAGCQVLLVDKGRRPGGRLATRSLGSGVFDHGAQFITCRDEGFSALMEQWADKGEAGEWHRTESEQVRWCGLPHMNSLAGRLAQGLDIETARRVEAILPLPGGVRIRFGEGGEVSCRALILTPPLPQSLALLEAGGWMPDATFPEESLRDIHYEPCLAVMARLDGPSGLPAPGCVQPERGPLAWLADNQMKGVSPSPALTLHATAAFSADHWDRDRQATAALLLDAAGAWVRAGVTEFQIHGWRYSRPTTCHEQLTAMVSRHPLVLIAGDAFGGPRVEGAYLSGRAAAARILAHRKP